MLPKFQCGLYYQTTNETGTIIIALPYVSTGAMKSRMDKSELQSDAAGTGLVGEAYIRSCRA